MCGARCRAERRRRLARRRRMLRTQDYRVDERERQRRRRERLRQQRVCGQVDPVGCHGPASDRKPSIFQEELVAIWDNAMRLSRASFQRRIPVILRGLARKTETEMAATTGLSRARSSPQPLEDKGDLTM